MPGSVTSVFSEAEEFEAALRAEAVLGLLVTGRGPFRARLTQVALHRLRLSATDEHLSRIALVAVPADMILVALPRGSGAAPIWDGIRIGAGEIMILGADQRLHMRTDGPCRWGSIWLPPAELIGYGSALTGTAFAVPAAARWRLRPAMGRHLRQLHSAAIALVESRSKTPICDEAAHGLEQQLIHALVEFVLSGSALAATPTTCEHRDVAVRFEALLQAQPERSLGVSEICATLGVSKQTLRKCCEEQLGMGPSEYVRRTRMQLVHRALRSGNPEISTIAALARHNGFRNPGRFTSSYRALYGEPPSATLRRAFPRRMRQLGLTGRA